jgi:hypothetical protein
LLLHWTAAAGRQYRLCLLPLLLLLLVPLLLLLLACAQVHPTSAGSINSNTVAAGEAFFR